MPAFKPSLIPSRLRKFGITLVERDQALLDNVILRCDACGEVWSCNSKIGGHLLPGYWKCPNGCNHPPAEPAAAANTHK